MVRETMSIKDTLKAAQEFLKKNTNKKVNISIKRTIEEAIVFLRSGEIKASRNKAPVVLK